mmetsp:Transcript_52342/g.131485  ORF Transcript_52342/g.131485 Transcript_52342/m.131485 type:complete len:451 (+) Transcript_52342:177-1529(+)|eukprot:CAMPEP_0177648394 /NCGR_PEP_ID=MMETSP0447-20121125/10803_1 /TAXON_ID=0 /ORGANISM="Stygamoeba regulata, Strain BSH-02190019" /LENGTH=450 /DNA_ID=CAMNT_0019151029 /DNA_START=168 /DNA_END=1520 /DNA_ORIENTATION=-
MGKILILYDSATGCTEQMARYVLEGVRDFQDAGMEVRFRSVDDATKDDVFWCDGMAVGTPTNLGGYSWKMKKFWDDNAPYLWPNTDGKIACAFSSAGAYGGGSETACLSMLIVLMNFGFLVFGVTDYVAEKHTLHYGAITAKEPRAEEEKAGCRRLGLRLAEWVSVYVDHKGDTHHPLLTTKKKDKEEETKKQEIKEQKQKLKAQTKRDTKLKVLVFHKAAAYKHESIPAAVCKFKELAVSHGWHLVATEEAETHFDSIDTLKEFDIIVFVSNSGELFNEQQKDVFKQFVELPSKGIYSLHASIAAFLSDQDPTGNTPMGNTWPFYGDVMGAYFVRHPPPEERTIHVNKSEADKVGLSALPDHHTVLDEWYEYDRDPKSNSRLGVVVYVDKGQGQPALDVAVGHPVVWHHHVGTTRVFYNGLGHFAGAFDTSYMHALLVKGIEFCAGKPT